MGTKGRMIKTYAHPLQHAIMLALSFVKENHHKPTKMYTTLRPEMAKSNKARARGPTII